MTFRLTRDRIKIYGAGKTWASPRLRELRNHGFHLVSRWIDAPQCLTSPDDNHSPETHENESLKGYLWNLCKEDTKRCDLMLWLCSPEDGEMQSGALVELGHVTMLDKPVYIIGTCASVEPVGHSDRAWKSQPNVYHWPHIKDALEGAKLAIAHYQKNYRDFWFERHGMPGLTKKAA